MNVKEIDKQYIANTYARFDLQLVKGKGSLVYDEAGKEYIDLGTGIAVNGFEAVNTGSLHCTENSVFYAFILFIKLA